MAASSSIREERITRTRSDIVDAAMGLFIESGFDATTIDEIARRAGIGRRTFFRYFPTKEAVLFSDFRARQLLALEWLEAAPPDEPEFHALVRVLGDLCDLPPEPGQSVVIQRVVRASPALRDRQRLMAVDVFARDLVAVLQARDGARPEIQTRLLVLTVLDCSAAAAVVYLRGSDRRLRELFDEAVETCRAAWATLPA